MWFRLTCFLAAWVLLACSEEQSAGEAAARVDADAPDVAVAQDTGRVGPADAGLTDEGPVARPTPCATDEDCGLGAFCEAATCRLAPDTPVVTWQADGVTRAAAAAFEITPEYLEPWTDRAGPACPENRAGRFDGRVDQPPCTAPCADPCADTYEDANANGYFDAVWLGGPGGDRPASGVDNDNPPAGRVLVLARDDQLQVLVALDVFALESAQAHVLALRLAARLGVPPTSVTLLTTGVRSGPDAVGLSGPSLERFGRGADLRARLGGGLGLVGSLPMRSGVPDGLFDALALRAAAAVRQAADRLSPVRLRFGLAALPVAYDPPAGPVRLPDEDADGVANDAQDLAGWRSALSPLARDTALPGGPDPDLGVLALENAVTGAPLVVVGIWGAAPATRLDSTLLSADYPGRFRAIVERTYPGAVALWLAGPAADTLLAGEGAFIPEVDGAGQLLDAAGLPTDVLDAAAAAGDPTTALARLLVAQAVAVLAAAAPMPVHLEVGHQTVWLPLTNPRIGLAARLGLLPRLGDWLTGRAVSDAWASGTQAPACGGLGCLRHRLDRIDLGPLTLVTTPGALDLAFALGRPEASVAFGDERNLLDLDADGLPDAEDPELRLQLSGDGRETSVVVDGPANPQQFPAVVGLETDGVWLVGRAGGLGSLSTRTSVQNVFEGQLSPLLEATDLPATAAVDACLTWPCHGSITLGALAAQAWAAQPEVLADLPGAHELWLLEEPPVEEIAAWRIEDPTGGVRVQGDQGVLGPGRRAWLPEQDLPAQGVDRGDVLIVTTPDAVGFRLAIGGIVPVELRQHPNAGDTWRAAFPASGDRVYNAACDLLFGDACPHRRMGGEPIAGLPGRP